MQWVKYCEETIVDEECISERVFARLTPEYFNRCYLTRIGVTGSVLQDKLLSLHELMHTLYVHGVTMDEIRMFAVETVYSVIDTTNGTSISSSDAIVSDSNGDGSASNVVCSGEVGSEVVSSGAGNSA